MAIAVDTQKFQNYPSQVNTKDNKVSEKEKESIFENIKDEVNDWINDNDKICEDGQDDGKLSWKEKAEHFGKGLAGVVKAAVNNPIATGVAVAAGVGLTALTGGAALPVLCALGVAGGAVTIGKGAYDAAQAKTDAEAKQAWETMGNGTFALGASVLGAKGSLKTAGIDNVDDMSTAQAVKGCFDYTKEAGKLGIDMLKGNVGSGVYIDPDNVAHLTSKGKVDYQMYEMQTSGMGDYVESMDAKKAMEYLKFFDDYPGNISLNPNSEYSFLQAHGSMQLYNKTESANVLSTYTSIKNPVKQVIAYNVNQ